MVFKKKIKEQIPCPFCGSEMNCLWSDYGYGEMRGCIILDCPNKCVRASGETLSKALAVLNTVAKAFQSLEESLKLCQGFSRYRYGNWYMKKNNE